MKNLNEKRLKFDVEDIYNDLLDEWKEEQKKKNRNTKPGEGTRKRLMREAELIMELEEEIDKKYDELLKDWKEEQEELGLNKRPGEGTRSRLRREASKEVLKLHEGKETKEDNKLLSFEMFEKMKYNK